VLWRSCVFIAVFDQFSNRKWNTRNCPWARARENMRSTNVSLVFRVWSEKVAIVAVFDVHDEGIPFLVSSADFCSRGLLG
jgi:hypothetical protein